MASTIARRLSTLSSFYKYCQIEDIVDKNPAANIRRPKVNDESRTLGLDRNELGALLVQAGLGDLRDGALITLLVLNGLRISEALKADIDDLSTERGHRTLAIVRKRGKHVTVPIAPRTGRALELYIDERTMGPIFLGVEGGRMDRYCADRMVKRLVKKAGSTSGSRPTVSATRSSPQHSTPASRCVTSEKQPATLTREPRCAMTERGAASTGTPPTSCRRSSLERPDRGEAQRQRLCAMPSDWVVRSAGCAQGLRPYCSMI